MDSWDTQTFSDANHNFLNVYGYLIPGIRMFAATSDLLYIYALSVLASLFLLINVSPWESVPHCSGEANPGAVRGSWRKFAEVCRQFWQLQIGRNMFFRFNGSKFDRSRQRSFYQLIA